MHALLDLDLHWRILAVCSVPILFAFLLQWVTQHSPIAGFFQSYTGIVGPYFGSIGILFALFAAFLGADIWGSVQESGRSVEHEAGAIQSLRQIARTQGQDGTAIERRLNHYIETRLAQESDLQETGRSEDVDQALEELVTAVLDPALSVDAHRTAQGAMLQSYRDIRQARSDRLQFIDSHSDPYKWTAVILLGLLTQVAIAMVHFDNRKAQGAAVFVFTIAFVVTLTVLVAHESPLADPELHSGPIHRLAQ